MIVTLTQERTINTVYGIPITTNTLTLTNALDMWSSKRVEVFIQELGKSVLLWSGTDYDNIGQWTDADVNTKVLELFDI